MFDKIKATITKYMYEKLSDDMEFYFNQHEYLGAESKNYLLAQGHPLLSTAMLFVSQIFAQAKFVVKDRNGNSVNDHWILDLLDNPGYSLTKNDFLLSLYFSKMYSGTAVVQMVRSAGFDQPTKLRILDYNKIDFPGIRLSDHKLSRYDAYKIMYDREFEASKIKIKDLVFIRDLPVVTSNIESLDGSTVDSRYIFTGKSRLNGLRQVLYNVTLSFQAKEVILKTNGKELFSSKNSEAPMGDKDKVNVKRKINESYGLTKGRSRAIITRASLDWKSLHIAIRDLGLDESVKTDSNVIFAALQIPRDILSLDGKKSSYKNQKESMVSYLQNTMQPVVNDVAQSLQALLEDGYTIEGGYEHLPVMKYILDQKYQGIIKQAEALKKLLEVGISWEDALDMVDMDSNLKRDEKRETEENTGGGDDDEGREEDEEEDGEEEDDIEDEEND